MKKYLLQNSYFFRRISLKEIVFFTRFPVKGSGKTRLRGYLNDEQILEINRKLIKQNFEIIYHASKEINSSLCICYDGDLTNCPFEVKKDIEFIKQSEGNLGVRMTDALNKALERSNEALLIGSDLIGLNTNMLKTCFDGLSLADFVFIPTEDGGFGAVAVKKRTDLLLNIKYSTDTVMEEIKEKAKKIGIKLNLIEKLSDIDTFEDLIKYESGSSRCDVLGNGEYNLNYLIDDNKVFRINLASQMNLGKKQIRYEFDALNELKNSSVVPAVYKCSEEGKLLSYGYLTMEYLEGRPLNYQKDMETAAYLLSKIHNTEVSKNSHLIKADEPFLTMAEEFERMYSVYKNWEKSDEKVKKYIDAILDVIEKSNKNEKAENLCIINTELNSGNFIIGEDKYSSYIIDWEKPLLGEREQDLAHFTVPTTTFWKTDTILDKSEVENFLDLYDSISEIKVNRRKFYKYFVFNIARGITWCSMAKVEYEGERGLKDEFTRDKIDRYLSLEFLDRMYNDYVGGFKDE